jgi:hypothetical protein
LIVLFAVAVALGVTPGRDTYVSRRGSDLVASGPGARSATVKGTAMEVMPGGGDPVVLNLAVHPFDATGAGFVIVDAGPIPPGAQLALLWVQGANPGEIHEQILKMEGHRVLPTALGSNAYWQGTIGSAALGVKNPGDRSVVVRGVDLRPSTLSLALGDMLSDWRFFTGWDGKSINVVFGGRDEQRVYLPPLAAGVALVALAGALVLARRRHRPVATWVAIPIIASWVLLDVRWQWQLGSQLRVTHAAFAGKTLEQRHAAMEHPAFFALVQAASKVLPRDHARIFVTSDFDYFRLRAGYYLYPYNVLAFDWADPSVLHSGDYLLLFAKNDVKFDDASGSLEWSGGRRVPAHALVRGDGEGLYQIR